MADEKQKANDKEEELKILKSKELKSSPYDRASIWSKLTFRWVGPLIDKGYLATLAENDLYPNISEADAQMLNDRYEKYVSDCKLSNSPYKMDEMISFVFRKYRYQICLFQCFETAFKIAGALLANWFCTAAEDHNEAQAIWFSVGSSIFLIINSAAHHQVFYRGSQLGMLVKIQINTILYKKLMNLTITNDAAAGQIVNMVSNDVQKVEDYQTFRHFFYFSAFELAAVCIIIGLTSNSSVTNRLILVGLMLVVLILILVAQVGISLQFTTLRKRMVVLRDNMVRYVSDMLTGMQVIKFYAWEQPFHSKIASIRQKVLHFIIGNANMRAISSILYFIVIDLLTMVVTTFAIVKEISILPADMSFARTAFSNINLVISYFLPKAIELYSEAKVSIKRFEEFMSKPEIKLEECVGDRKLLEDAGGATVVMKDAYFGWPGMRYLPTNATGTSLFDEEDASVDNEHPYALQKLNIILRQDQRTVVIGQVGSGKSALINSILQELPLVSGSLTALGPVSYCSQFPWLINTSVRENILMGRPFDPAHYKRVIEGCALLRDISLMPDGDATLVGERGSTLSGGQKARISLARALYYIEAKLFLLDDVFSAVDTIVGNQLFASICDILCGKTVVIVTHQLQIVRHCPQVILMQEGKVAFSGPYEDLLRSNLTYAQLLLSYDTIKEQSADSIVEQTSQIGQATLAAAFANDDLADFADASEFHSQQLATERNDSIGFRVYYRYFCAGNNLIPAILLIICSLFAQLTLIYFQDKIMELIDDYAFHTKKDHLQYALYVFLVECVAFFVAVFFFFRVSIACSRTLFSQMLNCVLRAPMRFFQVNPQGRILNRFSKDQAVVDEILFMNMSDAILLTFRTIICFYKVGANSAITLIYLPALIMILWMLQTKFFSVSKELKRLEATSRSSLYSHLSTTLEGLPIIRSFGVQATFIQRYFNLLNENSRALFSFIGVSRWFSFCVDFSCCTFYIVYAQVCNITLKSSMNNTQDLICSIGYCQEIAELVQWTARLIAEVVNNMTSVERIVDYTRIESEAPTATETDHLLPVGWPSEGRVEISNLSIRYPGRQKPALHGLCCKIRAGENVGIVGRTGAGKSTIISAGYRLVEAEPGGFIKIDDVDIAKLGLKKLRQSLSIIPQEPFLYKGDVRFNLDPFQEHEDDELWIALEAVQMGKKIKSLPGKLQATVLENGQNFSVGQKQLLCLARAILRHKKIIVFDEATANIDLATSAMILQTIDKQFKDRTKFTIAHRLHTIIKCDRLLVLEQGVMVECGAPHELLQDSRGYFSKMVHELGPEGEAHLKELAASKYIEIQRDHLVTKQS